MPLRSAARQDELRRHHDFAAHARQPGIDARIGAHDFVVAEVEAPRDVGKRVVLAITTTCGWPTTSSSGSDLETVRRDRGGSSNSGGITGSTGRCGARLLVRGLHQGAGCKCGAKRGHTNHQEANRAHGQIMTWGARDAVHVAL